MIYTHNGILFSHKNELRIEICYKWMDKIMQKYIIVSEIRPGIKRQILYGSCAYHSAMGSSFMEQGGPCSHVHAWRY